MHNAAQLSNYLHIDGGRGRGGINVLQGGHGSASSVDPRSLHLMDRQTDRQTYTITP